jgi:hypothetical protein
MGNAVTQYRPQEQALVRAAEELGIVHYRDGAMLIDLANDDLKQRFNVLAPATTIAKADPNFTPAISVVTLDPGDFYGIDFEGSGDNRRATSFALSKVQLDQIAKVAGIEDLPPNIVYMGEAAANVRVTWTARMRRPDGTWQSASGSREWLEQDEKEKLQASVPKYVTDKGPADRSNPAYNDWWAKNWYDRVKKHRLAMTETKARLRCYRSLLTVKAKYRKDDLGKPFLIASTSFTPDTSDIRILGMMMSQGQQAVDMLYGSGGHELDQPIDVDIHDDPPAGVNPETGEVTETPTATSAPPKTHGERPADDRQIPRGPRKGWMLSEVCEKDPGYARSKLLGAAPPLGPLTAEWLVYFHGSERGGEVDDFSNVEF